MPIEFTGLTKELKRTITKLYSFDNAFENAEGDIGLPHTLMEIYGAEGLGKTTITLSLAGMFKPDGIISYAELEPLNIATTKNILSAAGFQGTFNIILEESDNVTLEKVAKSIVDGANVAVIDALGSIIPKAEADGDIGDANMGRRAKDINQFCRRIQRHYKFVEHDFMVVMINHEYDVIGGWGTYTPGGTGKNYASKVRIALKKAIYKKKRVPNLIAGKITKNNYGYIEKEFYLYVLPGYGIHRGMTALWDCIIFEHAKIDRTVKMGDESFGFYKEFEEAAKNKDDEKFIPFLEKIDQLYVGEDK